jgi:hypothetical protein
MYQLNVKPIARKIGLSFVWSSPKQSVEKSFLSIFTYVVRGYIEVLC